LQITEDRKKRVIALYFDQHKTYAEIAQIMKMSPRDIHAIIKEEKAKRQRLKDQQQQEETSSKAYKLFSDGKKPVEVAIELSLIEQAASKYYREYWRLKRLYILNSIFKATNGELGTFLKLYRLMKEKGMTIENVVNAVEIAIHKLPYMEGLYKQVKDEVEKLQHIRQLLVNDIEELKYKLSILDKTAFSCEQESWRKAQQVQELTAQKNRLEKLIAKISNNDDKLKRLVKENVKAVISENKELISICFTAVIQTLKADPQMVKLIQNMPTKNDGEQHKDNHINIYQYIESNKDRILDLAENNYKNLVEVLTKHAIDIAASASSSSLNPTLSLLHSLSTFSNSLDQNDTYRIEEPESFHHSKGDISD
jgi:hypothetical protein